MPMERTELREAFFAEVHRDPYTHLIHHMVTEMWAHGYERALKDAGEEARRRGNCREADGWYWHVQGFCEELLRLRPWRRRLEDAQEFLTGDDRRREVMELIALSDIGARLDRKDGGK